MVSKIIHAFSVFSRIYKGYRSSIIALAFLGFISGLLEGVGVSVLVPLFSFLIGDGTVGGSRISALIGGMFSFIGVGVSIWTLLVGMAVLFSLKAVAVLAFGYVRTKIIVDYEKDTRARLYKGMLGSEWPYLLHQKIGHLENVLMIDVNFGSMLLKQVSGVILSMTNFLMYVAVALFISVSITSATIVAGVLLLAVMHPLITRTRIYAKERFSLNKLITHHINEHVVGMKLIKAFHVEEGVGASGDKFFTRVRKVRMKQYIVQSIFGSVIQPSSVIFIIGVFAVLYHRPSFNLASFIAVIYLIQKIFGNFYDLQSAVQALVDTIPYVEKVGSVSDEIVRHRESYGGTLPFSFERDLSFSSVFLAYDGKPALSDVSFRVAKGGILGIIGPSGSGKTSIADLMLRLFRPTGGSVTLDGRSASDYSLDQWRRHVGYVPQDVFLKNDTIENNIRFYDLSITSDDIRRAAAAAHILPFIEGLPDGFLTAAGERGVLLSGGQRQRIALARTLARKPDILILDEATSAVDSESEAAIQKSIEELRGRVTIIIIAHRASTVMRADRLIALDEGRIVEEGSPRELLQNPDSYFSRMHARG